MDAKRITYRTSPIIGINRPSGCREQMQVAYWAESMASYEELRDKLVAAGLVIREDVTPRRGRDHYRVTHWDDGGTHYSLFADSKTIAQ